MRSTPLVLLALAGCASTAPPRSGGPRGLRADEHLSEARRHDQTARERESWPVTTTMTPGIAAPVPMPWYRTWNTSADHERLAKQHRSQAARLQLAFDEACRDVAAEHVRGSPIASLGAGGAPIDGGALVYLRPSGVGPDALLARLRCHRAWMMLSPAMDMDACPLDLPGLRVDARGDVNGVTLELRVDDPAMIPELQRRVAKQLELGTSHHHGPQ